MSSGTEQAQAAAAAGQTVEAPSLLDQVIAATRPQSDVEAERAKDYFQQFLDQVVKPGQVVSKDVETNIKYWIGEIDKKLSAQLNEIMHDPGIPEAGSRPGAACTTWSTRSETGENLKIRVLNVKQAGAVQGPGEGGRVRPEHAVQEDLRGGIRPARRPAVRDAGRRLRVRPQRRGRQPAEDDLQRGGRGRTRRSSPPPAPKMFSFDSFTELANPRDLAKIFERVEYAAWKSFRESEDSRYVALTMPRVLARLPYGENFKRVDEFNFEESVDGKDHDKYSLDERRVGLRRAHHRRLRQVRLDGPARAASRAAARSRACRSTRSRPTTATWP